MEEPNFVEDLHAGLARSGQKELPSKYLYDEVGSALFEVICVVPEYGLTRADTRLLKQHAAKWVERLPAPVTVAELGSGTSKKTRLILEPLGRRQPTTYFPIDISAAALAQCARELGELSELGAMEVVGLNLEYLAGLREVAARRPPGNHLLILFLGSTIGNFDRQQGEAFLRGIREILLPGDHLFLSADLVKPEAALLSAYDDTAGVTAAFNKNVLCRINRELGGNFDLKRFEHVARWNTTDRRIEMHLQAREQMTVTIAKAALRVEFQAGETIKTEDSYKYELSEIVAMAQRSGFVCEEQWVDPEWPFSQSLLRAG
ncbi:MAG TPA: L-histidine N(alpha)-methyltransferase [Pseudomonadota bacterium]|nr:L-histidine N(alpha)-methyltransferase [Pseudomonadota bacterium]